MRFRWVPVASALEGELQMSVVCLRIPAFSLLVAGAISIGASVPAWADYISGELGGAADFTLFDTSTNGNISMANASSAGFVLGNVGVSGTHSGNFSDSGVSITGALDLGGAQTANFSGGASASGGVFSNR